MGTDYPPNMLDIARQKRGQLDTKTGGLLEYQQAAAQDPAEPTSEADAEDES